MNNKHDEISIALAKYVANKFEPSRLALDTARACLADSLGCAILALKFPACTKLLGPIIPDTKVPHGTHIPGTKYVLDPILGAFNIGSMIRWLDYNDTWLAAEWGHPSDNLGALLAISDHLSRKALAENKKVISVHDLLLTMIQAYEIQGVMALSNSFNRMGFDHVILVKLASAAVSTRLLGGSYQQILDAVTQVWIDVGPLRTYRHAPNTGSRKSWAAGDATSRGAFLAYLTMRGEKGYATALSAEKWGMQEVIFKGKPIVLTQQLDSYVMENILFKISFPAEFHAQTAVECAFKLYPKVKNKIDDIKGILIETHESAIRIIDKKGPLHNPADRDHCLQYMVAIGLLFGELTAHHYEDSVAVDPRIDQLRALMKVQEKEKYSQEYLDPKKRSIANAVTITFKDGSTIGPIEVEYPLGHKFRRNEGLPLLFEKFENNLRTHYSEKKTKELSSLFQNHDSLIKLPVAQLIDLLDDHS